MQSPASAREPRYSAPPAPLRLWLGPVARSQCEQLLRASFPRAEVVAVPSGDVPLAGPAILVLDADDLTGAAREPLRRLAELALPGRPIILGGTASKHTLLDAINTWRAVQLIRRRAIRSTLLEALRDAYSALAVECSIHECVEMLRSECQEVALATLELQATQERLLHAERLAAVGRMVGSLLTHTRERFGTLERIRAAQHDIPENSPLSSIYDCAVSGIDSFGALLEDMLALADERDMKGEPRVVELMPLIQRCVRLFAFDSLGRQRDVQIADPQDLRVKVRVDPHRICHVMLNLLRNAAQATEAHQRIIVRASRAGDWTLVEVEDFGHGMNEEALANLFRPFFTTKGEAGMGLGLRLAKGAIESHGGTLTCTSKLNEGSCFRIQLPAASD